MRKTILLASVILALSACGGDDDSTGPGGVPQSSSLSDNQVIGVLVTANMGEAQFSQLGVDQATSADVHAFASDMVGMHGAALAHVNALSAEENLPPADSEITARLKSDTSAAQDTLVRAQPGNDWDMTFMCAQVRMHRTVLGIIDDSLAASAKARKVKDEVTDTRPAVDDHRKKAESLVESLAGGKAVDDACADFGGAG